VRGNCWGIGSRSRIKRRLILKAPPLVTPTHNLLPSLTLRHSLSLSNYPRVCVSRPYTPRVHFDKSAARSPLLAREIERMSVRYVLARARVAQRRTIKVIKELTFFSLHLHGKQLKLLRRWTCARTHSHMHCAPSGWHNMCAVYSLHNIFTRVYTCLFIISPVRHSSVGGMFVSTSFLIFSRLMMTELISCWMRG
jgi:hypothetical protein